MLRIRNEELENDLVKYKLLYVSLLECWYPNLTSPYRYAEAMHENADREATTSQRFSSLSLR